MIVQHGLPGTRTGVIEVARQFAAAGIVTIAIMLRGLARALPRIRRPHHLHPARGRIGYIGVSYGGAMGGLLAGVEHRISAYALVVGDGGLVTHSTGPDDIYGPFWSGGHVLPPRAECDALAWFSEEMGLTPADPVC